jgi:hypothetical protein
MSYIHWLVVLSALIGIVGSYAYIRDTLAGRTQPNRVSWFLWALAPLIGTGAALSAQADIWVTVRIFLAGFLPLLVFIASFINKKSYWKITSFDIICGSFSVLALIAWLIFDSFQLAILAAVIADGFATLPTIRKAWIFPKTETGLAYILGFVSTILILPSIPTWNIENSAFQIYLLIANFLLLTVVYRKKIFFRPSN